MRKVIITNSSYLIGFDDLSRHPAITKCWSLPRDYTLFEVTDPIFANSGDMHPPSAQMAAAIVEEAALFAPFYRGLRSLADIKALHIAGQTASYHLITLSRAQLHWPITSFEENWDMARSLWIACRLRRRFLEGSQLLRGLFVEWQTWMEQLGQTSRHAETEGAPGRYLVQYHFTQPCGACLMALLMLLAHTSHVTSLKSVTFSPNELSLRAREEANEDLT